ncbi:hypothetical protein PFISCL1PPCAC_8987, partial [Pristionchus fissidentatus]
DKHDLHKSLCAAHKAESPVLAPDLPRSHHSLYFWLRPLPLLPTSSNSFTSNRFHLFLLRADIHPPSSRYARSSRSYRSPLHLFPALCLRFRLVAFAAGA